MNLSELMKDEKKAPKDYKGFLDTLRTKKDKDIIRGIIKQERRHLKLLKQIRSRK